MQSIRNCWFKNKKLNLFFSYLAIYLWDKNQTFCIIKYGIFAVNKWDIGLFQLRLTCAGGALFFKHWLLHWHIWLARFVWYAGRLFLKVQMLHVVLENNRWKCYRIRRLVVLYGRIGDMITFCRRLLSRAALREAWGFPSPCQPARLLRNKF